MGSPNPTVPSRSGQPPTPPPTPSQTPAKAPEGDSAHLDVTGASILIVDDNEQNLELLQAYLEDLGCPIRTARDGLEALASIAAAEPDIILLDVMMPRMSGFQACARLKADPRLRDIPVIMVTALNEVGDVERAVDSGADDFLTKPVNRLELLTRVRSLLRVRILKKQLDRTLAEMKRMNQGG